MRSNSLACITRAKLFYFMTQTQLDFKEGYSDGYSNYIRYPHAPRFKSEAYYTGFYAGRKKINSEADEAFHRSYE